MGGLLKNYDITFSNAVLHWLPNRERASPPGAPSGQDRRGGDYNATLIPRFKGITQAIAEEIY